MKQLPLHVFRYKFIYPTTLSARTTDKASPFVQGLICSQNDENYAFSSVWRPLS